MEHSILERSIHAEAAEFNKNFMFELQRNLPNVGGYDNRIINKFIKYHEEHPFMANLPQSFLAFASINIDKLYINDERTAEIRSLRQDLMVFVNNGWPYGIYTTLTKLAFMVLL